MEEGNVNDINTSNRHLKYDSNTKKYIFSYERIDEVQCSICLEDNSKCNNNDINGAFDANITLTCLSVSITYIYIHICTNTHTHNNIYI